MKASEFVLTHKGMIENIYAMVSNVCKDLDTAKKFSQIERSGDIKDASIYDVLSDLETFLEASEKKAYMLGVLIQSQEHEQQATINAAHPETSDK